MVAGPADEPGIDDHPDAGQGDRGLRHVGGAHHPATPAFPECPRLLLQGQSPVQWEHIPVPQTTQTLHRTGDLALSGEEHQHVPLGRRRGEGGRDAVLQAAHIGQHRLIRRVDRPHRILPPLGVQVRAPQVGGNLVSVERRGHRDELFPIPHQEQGQEEVEVQAALVELVQDDGREPVGVPGLHHAEGHPGGDVQDLGVDPGPPLVPYRVADPPAERGPLQLRHPHGQAAAGHPPRLDHQNPAPLRAPPRNLGGLARSGGRGHHHGTARDGREQVRAYRLDGQVHHTPRTGRSATPPSGLPFGRPMEDALEGPSARTTSPLQGRAARWGVVIAYILVFWVLLPAVLWTAAQAIDATLDWQARPWWGGAVVAGAGLFLLGWGIAALWRRGEGLPISALPPPKLVARGPYRLARHPIYLGFNVFLFGWGLLAGSPALTAVVAPLFLPVWVGYALVEERGLVRRFGQAYLRYRRRVGLFPRLTLMPLLHPMCWLGVIRVRATGQEHLAGVGGAVLVINHSCYIDPVFAVVHHHSGGLPERPHGVGGSPFARLPGAPVPGRPGRLPGDAPPPRRGGT
ncbi:MAG: hypothetical protein JRI25_29600, partial [Deltaproteobacteria bacterium]|nr:hypothetical protein [Deltaproteobacteria bacterium]